MYDNIDIVLDETDNTQSIATIRKLLVYSFLDEVLKVNAKSYVAISTLLDRFIDWLDKKGISNYTIRTLSNVTMGKFLSTYLRNNNVIFAIGYNNKNYCYKGVTIL